MDTLPVNLATDSQHGGHVDSYRHGTESVHHPQPQSPPHKHHPVDQHQLPQPLTGYVRGDQSMLGKQWSAYDLPPADPYQPPSGMYSVDPQHLPSTNHLQAAAMFHDTGQAASDATSGPDAANTERHFSIEAAFTRCMKLFEELAQQQQLIQHQLFNMACMESAIATAPYITSPISTAPQNEQSTIEVRSCSLDQSARRKSLDMGQPKHIEAQSSPVDANVQLKQVMQIKRSTSLVVQIHNLLWTPSTCAATTVNQFHDKNLPGIKSYLQQIGQLFPPRISDGLHQDRFFGHEPLMIPGNNQLKPPWPPPASIPDMFFVSLFTNCPAYRLRGGREPHSVVRNTYQNKRNRSVRSRNKGVKSAPRAVFGRETEVHQDAVLSVASRDVQRNITQILRSSVPLISSCSVIAASSSPIQPVPIRLGSILEVS